MRFCLLIVASLLAVSCSGQGAASQDANAPVILEMTQMYVTIRNNAGLALNDASVAIVPMGRTTIFNKFLGRLESAETRNVMLGEFVGRDGTPFSLRVIKPRSVEFTGKDVKGQQYKTEVAWR